MIRDRINTSTVFLRRVSMGVVVTNSFEKLIVQIFVSGFILAQLLHLSSLSSFKITI